MKSASQIIGGKGIEGNPHSFQYRRDYGHVGKCLIINNETFAVMPKRNGTEQDRKLLQMTFESLKFIVQVEDNLTVDGMQRVLQKVSEEDHGDRTCFVCVLLSHGEDGAIFGTDGVVPLHRLTSLLTIKRCPTLAGKPKLFFIQACRGNAFDPGVETDSAEEDQSADISHIPEKDFLCSFSTVSGYSSWRNSTTGSIYIRYLCQMMQESRGLEITKILTRVNHRVAHDFESNTFDWSSTGKKQMPCIMSTLTKEVHLNA